MLIDRITCPANVRAIYEQLIDVCFPPDEKPTADQLVAAVESGQTLLYGAKLADRWVGEVALECFGEKDIMLLSWLSTNEANRGHGLGSKLLAHALAEATSMGAKWLIGEIEDPTSTPSSPAHGDPAARTQFYARRGAKALLLDYQQPPIGPAKQPVELLLIVFSQAELPDALPSKPLNNFLKNYVGNHHPTWNRLAPSLEQPEIELVELDSTAFAKSRLSGNN